MHSDHPQARYVGAPEKNTVMHWKEMHTDHDQLIRASRADSRGTQSYCSEANETNTRGHPGLMLWSPPRPMPGDTRYRFPEAPETKTVKHWKEMHSDHDQGPQGRFSGYPDLFSEANETNARGAPRPMPGAPGPREMVGKAL